MKTDLRQARWLVMAAFLLGGLHEVNAWYSPSQQRWINRDPEEEKGGINLYEFQLNNPILYLDAWGAEPNLPPGWTGPGKPYNPKCNPYHPPGPPLKCVLLAASIPSLAMLAAEACMVPTSPACITAAAALALAMQELNECAKDARY